MIKTGTVVAVYENAAMVCFSKEDMCGHCNGCDRSKKETSVRVLGEACIGDRVLVELPDNKLIAMSFIMYIIPLVIMLLGMYFADKQFKNEAYVLLIGISMLCIGLFVVYLIDRKLRKHAKWQAHIIGLEKEEKSGE